MSIYKWSYKDASKLTFSGKSALFYALVLVGAFFPTSLPGQTPPIFFFFGAAASAMLLAVLAMLYGIDLKMVIAVTLPIITLFVIFTVISAHALVSYDTVSVGTLIAFLMVALLYCLPIRSFRPDKPERILTLWSAANLLMGAAILSGSHFVASFLTSFYNNYYEELLPMMMSQRKSVLTYASHSLAGFFLYLFFWVNLRSYKATGKSRYLIFAVGHAALCMTLLSHTSFVFSAVASMELIWFFCSKRPLLTAALGLIFLWFAWNAIPRVIGVDDWGKVKTLAVLFWQGDAGGVTARYARTGTQGSALEFIKEGGLPIGAIRSEAISPFVSDSGPIDYFLRGSLPLLLLMYGGLWFFLRRNLINRSDCYRLFFAILAAEVGIEVLPYTRTFCLLPVFMVLLNSLAIRSELPPGRKLRIKF